MTDRSPTPPTAHAAHDLLLVAAFAADDVEAADRIRAEALLASCAECTALAADLQAIARATAELPAAVRPRDFTLRPEDAARLRPLGWRRLAAAFGARRLDVTRPLAAGLTTLGLAGLLVSGLPLLPLGGSAGAAASAAPSPAPAAAAASDAPALIEKAGEPIASAAASGPVLTDRGAPVPAPSATGRDDRAAALSRASPSAATSPAYGTAASPGTAAGGGAGASTSPAPQDALRSLASGPESGSHLNLPLLAVSAGLLVVGLGIFALRRATKNAGGA